MSATVAVYAALSIQSYLYFLGKSHFGNIYIYNKLIAYVRPELMWRVKLSARFQSYRVWKCLKKPPLKLTNKKCDYFPRGPQNGTVSNLFGDLLSRSFNVIGQFMKKCCLLLFSISVAIGQFSFKWPGSSSCTVIVSSLRLMHFEYINRTTQNRTGSL